jgi:dTDP-4-dehydrorhamnose reductase
MLKILLLGKNGQLGWELQRSLSCIGEVIALGHTEADFTHPSALAAVVATHRPHVIVNAAAYTAVDKAEDDATNAHKINAESPAVLAQAAQICGALLVHYSTDYVFDGSGSKPWQEADATGPLNVYGASKLKGEQAIIQSGCQYLIFRTSWVYAARGGNFAKTMLRLAQERDTLKVIDDQFGVPTGADWLADMTARALVQTLADPSKQGLYNAVVSGETTWHGYASYVVAQAKTLGYAVKAEAIQPVATSEFPTPAKRPSNSRLNPRKLQLAFNIHCPPWQAGVQRMLQTITP